MTESNPTPATTHHPDAQQYFPTAFPVWNREAASVLAFIQSRKGIDVGCGRRSLHADMYRVDKDVSVDPDMVADAQALVGVASDQYDFYWSSHNIEHCPDTLAVLREAKRVVRPGGYVVLIIPNRTFTEGRDPTHVHEWTPEEYIAQFARPIEGLRLVDFGVAAPEWSFRVVYQKEGLPPAGEPVEAVMRRGLADFAPRDFRLNPLRISAVTDHPRLTTGFATVGRMIYAGFQQALYKLSVLGIWEFGAAQPGEFPYLVEPVCEHDFFGVGKLSRFIRQTAPEVIFSLADPSTQWTRLQTLIPGFGSIQSNFRPPAPLLLYMPIEGRPIAPQFLDVVRVTQDNGGKVVVYTECQAYEIEKATNGEYKVEWVYHGLDHAPFRPYPEAQRQKMRASVGWDDRFVVMNIARNKRTNRQPEIIRAAQILRDLGHTDVLFYLHCDPMDVYSTQYMQGWDLDMLAREAGVWGFQGEDAHKNMVLFPPAKLDQTHGIAYNRPTGFAPVATGDGIAQRGLAFANMSYIDRLNLCDVYLDPSSVQGFGLPAGEAAMCGCPLLMTDDKFTRREIWGDAPIWLQPSYIDTWQTGAELQMVTADEIVSQVLWLKRNRAYLAEMRQKSQERARTMTWKVAQDKFVTLAKEIAGIR